jgi:hypothetical protein
VNCHEEIIHQKNTEQTGGVNKLNDQRSLIQFALSRKNCCAPATEFVKGLVAAGMFVNVPETVGADCRANLASAQLKAT